MQKCSNLYGEISFSEKECEGTWSNLQYSLVHILGKNQEAFEQIIRQLIVKNSRGLLAAFEHFDYLIGEMHNKDFNKFVASLLFSSNSKERKIGILFFQKLNNINFGNIETLKYTNLQLNAVILEFTTRPWLAGIRLFFIFQFAYNKFNNFINMNYFHTFSRS